MGFASLVIAALVAVALVWRWSRMAADGDQGAKGLALLLTTVLLMAAAAGLLLAFFLFALRCDESCVGDFPLDRGSPWRYTSDAWQWWGQVLVALAGTISVVSALVSLFRENYSHAPIWLGSAALCFGAWAVFLAPFGSGLGI